LEDAIPGVRVTAAVGLGFLSPTPSQKILNIIVDNAAGISALRAWPEVSEDDSVYQLLRWISQDNKIRSDLLQRLLETDDQPTLVNGFFAAEDIAFREPGTAVPLVQAACRLLTDTSSEVRQAAFRFLGMLADPLWNWKAKDLRQLLAACDEDQLLGVFSLEPSDRFRAIILGLMCRLKSRNAIEVLRDLLESGRPFPKSFAAVFDHIGPWGRELLPLIVRRLDNIPTDSNARIFAIRAIGRFRGDAAFAVSTLTDHLKGKEKYSVCAALGAIGPPAKPALPALKRCILQTDDVCLFNNAVTACRKILDEPTIARLLEEVAKKQKGKLRERAVELRNELHQR
jgi:hypothetical protein